MRISTTLAGVASLFALNAIGAEADAEYRQHTMQAVGGHMQAIVKIIRGEVPHAGHLPIHGNAMADLAETAGALFPEGSEGGDALPAIWEDTGRLRRENRGVPRRGPRVQGSRRRRRPGAGRRGAAGPWRRLQGLPRRLPAGVAHRGRYIRRVWISRVGRPRVPRRRLGGWRPRARHSAASAVRRWPLCR